jgi:hypothetical protein
MEVEPRLKRMLMLAVLCGTGYLSLASICGGAHGHDHGVTATAPSDDTSA